MNDLIISKFNSLLYSLQMLLVLSEILFLQTKDKEISFAFFPDIESVS